METKPELCGGYPLPTSPPPPPASPNGRWSCIDDKPVWVEDIGEYLWYKNIEGLWMQSLKK